jgi:hypothetical protein
MAIKWSKGLTPLSLQVWMLSGARDNIHYPVCVFIQSRLPKLDENGGCAHIPLLINFPPKLFLRVAVS